MEPQNIDFSTLNIARIGHNFLSKLTDGNYTVDELNRINAYINFVLTKENRDFKKLKIGLMFVCINENYWPYIKPVVTDAKTFFLPWHEVEIMVWTDMPSYEGVTLFPVESVGWPYPTLMRYHMFLKQEEYLKKFDYLFYLDLDMRIVNIIGDEILGDGLTAAEHPMYSLRNNLYPPYEPNPKSASYIPRPGKVIQDEGKPRFRPYYFAGGFQGGTTETFIPAMKGTKKLIDADLTMNYIPIWNDESAWNRYLFDNPPSVVLSPSYVYPDSMINEYYIKIWGRDYPKKIITLTKPFSISSEGGKAATEMIKTL